MKIDDGGTKFYSNTWKAFSLCSISLLRIASLAFNYLGKIGTLMTQNQKIDIDNLMVEGYIGDYYNMRVRMSFNLSDEKPLTECDDAIEIEL